MVYLCACHVEARGSPSTLFKRDVMPSFSFWNHNFGLITPNVSPIEIHVDCLNSTGRVEAYFFLPSQPCSAAYHDKVWVVLFQKQVRYGFAIQTDFELHPLSCRNVTSVLIRLKFIPTFTNQTHILLTHCIPAFVFNSTEVGTAAIKIF